MTILFDGVESNLPFVSGFSTISSKALTYPLFGVDEDMEGMVGTPTHGVVCVDKGVVPTNTGDGIMEHLWVGYDQQDCFDAL